jgi:hypothetical protein
MAFEAFTVFFDGDGLQELLLGITGDGLEDSLPPPPEGYIDGVDGGYWQDPVSKKWHFIPGAGHYNDEGVYIFENLFKR